VKRVGAESVIEEIADAPRSYFVVRSDHNYDQFLALYRELGYAPTDKNEDAIWEERSRATWHAQDSILPGTCTGGCFEGRLVSSWGTIPISQNVRYGHSLCMVKTLPAAMTLFAQALACLQVIADSLDARYFAGSYAYHSRFTSVLQRPMRGAIRDQIEIEAVEIHDTGPLREPISLLIQEKAITDKERRCISSPASQFLREMCDPFAPLVPLHSVKSFTVQKGQGGELLGIVLNHNAWQEFTAANIFTRTWIFVTSIDYLTPSFVATIKEAICPGKTVLEVLLPSKPPNDHWTRCDPNVPFFWALTPRTELDALQRSFAGAFSSLISRYSSDEIKMVLGKFEIDHGV
jgi:hypothetical protein